MRSVELPVFTSQGGASLGLCHLVPVSSGFVTVLGVLGVRYACVTVSIALAEFQALLGFILFKLLDHH